MLENTWQKKYRQESTEETKDSVKPVVTRTSQPLLERKTSQNRHNYLFNKNLASQYSILGFQNIMPQKNNSFMHENIMQAHALINQPGIMTRGLLKSNQSIEGQSFQPEIVIPKPVRSESIKKTTDYFSKKGLSSAFTAISAKSKKVLNPKITNQTSNTASVRVVPQEIKEKMDQILIEKPKKSKRGRRQMGFETYFAESYEQIKKWEKELEEMKKNRVDKGTYNRLYNKKTALQSRLNKRKEKMEANTETSTVQERFGGLSKIFAGEIEPSCRERILAKIRGLQTIRRKTSTSMYTEAQDAEYFEKALCEFVGLVR